LPVVCYPLIDFTLNKYLTLVCGGARSEAEAIKKITVNFFTEMKELQTLDVLLDEQSNFY
jgi:hypothetical protein